MSALIGAILTLIVGFIFGLFVGVAGAARVYDSKIRNGIIILVDNVPYIANKCMIETRVSGTKEAEAK